MSSAERHLNPFPPKTQQAIETVYTTVESQPDQTDWLTVVSNLRQINRQLVEQIARLEHALASSQQTLETHKEEKQSDEITILQQQDELKITHERVGALFQQLETSHQIGQRQQILVETLSQQLEIAHTIIAQLETENNEASQQSQQQAEQLAKTEQLAVELHHRLQQQQTITTPNPTIAALAAATTVTPATEISLNPEIDAEIADIDLQVGNIDTTPHEDMPTPIKSTEESLKTPSVPTSPSIPDDLVPAWTPTPSTRFAEVAKTPNPVTTSSWQSKKTAVSLPKSTAQLSWREEIATTKIPSNYKPNLEPIVIRTPSTTPTPPPPAEIVNKESTAAESDGTPAKPSPNWPAPTVTKSQPASSTKTLVDVPKFSKK